MTTAKLPRVWREEFKVHSYEMGPSGFASPQAICRFLQESASNHASKLGFAAEEIDRLEQLWVLSQLSLRMQSYPNVCYVEWSLEVIPAIFRLKSKITELDIMFLAEAKYGGTVVAECYKSPEDAELYFQRIKDKSSGKILAQLRMCWKPKIL